jgi:hypothetical protein
VLKEAGKRFLCSSFKKENKSRIYQFLSLPGKNGIGCFGFFFKKDFFGNDRAADNKL